MIYPTIGRSNEPVDRAVSPVIGVILMVAITVILAAVIGAFVLDIGQDAANEAPQASFIADANAASDTVDIEHQGGDELVTDRTRLIIEASSSGETTFQTTAGSGDSKLSVGETAEVLLFSGSPDTLDLDADGATDQSANGAADPFAAGDEITITLVDTTTQRVVFQTTVRS